MSKCGIMKNTYISSKEVYQKGMDYVTNVLGIDRKEAEENLSCLDGIVIKIGGDCLNGDNPANLRLAQEIAVLSLLGKPMIVVHGGGSQIDLKMGKLGIPIEKIDGLRKTTLEALERCVIPALADVNWWLIKTITDYGGSAHSMIGEEVIYARQSDPRLEYVGQPTGVNELLLREKISEGYSPILWCIGYNTTQIGDDGKHQKLNINADYIPPVMVAAGLADRVVIVTGKGGVEDKDHHIISSIPYSRVESLIKDGTVTDGMVPKLRSSASIFKQEGLPPNFKVQIIRPDQLLPELLKYEGAGTELLNA